MSDPNRKRALRYSLFVAGMLVLAAWRVVVARSYADHIPFALWIAALSLFGAALFRPWRIARPDAVTLAVVGIVIAAIIPRIFGSEFDPYEVALDEAIHPLLGQSVLKTEPWRIFDGIAEHFNTPYLDLVLQAPLPGLHGARLMSAILAALSLLATYALAKRLYGRRETAIFSILVLGCAYWHVMFARTAYPFMQPMAIVPLALWVLVTGLQEDNNLLLYLGGVLLGLSTLVYTPGRIAVPLFATWWFVGALVGRLRRSSILPVALGLLVFLSPYFYRHSFAILLSRFRGTAGVTAISAAADQGTLGSEMLTAVAAQVQTAAQIYYGGEAWIAPHSGAPGPMLDRVTLGLALAGLLLCLLRWRRGASLLILLWVSAVFIGGQVLTDVPQSAYRAAPLLPALCIAAGSALTLLAGTITRVAKARREAVALAIGIVTVGCIAPPNLRLLNGFHEARFNDASGAMVRVVGNGDGRRTYYVVDIAPNVSGPRFQILAPGKDARDVASLNDLLGARLAEEMKPRSRGAVIIVGPPLRTAEQAIRRCYPGAIPETIPHWRGGLPPVAFWLRPEAITRGRSCKLTLEEERGLRATYYAGNSFDGKIVRTGLEDWSLRWMETEPADFGSIEWRGFLNVPVEGTYAFNLMSTSLGSTAKIGSKLVVGVGEMRSDKFAARSYPVTLRFRAEPGTSYGLFWAPPGGDVEVVPPSLFSPYPRNRSDQRWAE